MRMVNIGMTGMSVTELCHGTLILGQLQANLTPEEGAVAMRKSVEMESIFMTRPRVTRPILTWRSD